MGRCGGTIIVAVHRDSETGEFRLWYRTHRGDFTTPGGRSERAALMYATSKDGIQWTKPELGLFEWKGSRANNILGTDIPEGNVIVEPDDPDPARRYKAIAANKERGYVLLTSPDGIRWTRHTPAIAPVIRDQGLGYRGKQIGVGDTNWFNYDSRLGCYVWHTKVFIGGKRARAMLESDDLVHWSRPRVILCADSVDSPDTQLYDMNATFYESIWIAPLRVYHWKRFKRVEVQLAHSRDGRHFARSADRQVFLPLGPEEEWDPDYHIFVTPFFIDMGEELWIYYTGSRSKARSYDDFQHRIGPGEDAEGQFRLCRRVGE